MMDETEVQAIVAAEIEDAVSFIDSDIGPLRAGAVDRYFGRPYGDEEEGRSTVVSRDVHDTISAILPSLMKVFFGSENVVEFTPESREDVANAEQATDYINYIVTTDNDGFEVFYAAIKNALREKVGFIKWRWDKSITATVSSYSGLDEEALTLVLEDPSYELIESEQTPEGLKVKVRCRKEQDRARIEAVPPDEMIIGRRIKTLDDEGFVGHRCEKTVSELVAMGYDRDVVVAASSDGSELDTSDERLARFPYQEIGTDAAAGEASRLVLYVEGYHNLDQDGDGIAELRRICTIGTGYKIVSNEPVDERPFAALHCDPEPHAFFGESLADKVVDVQKVKTRVLRASLDSLSQSIFPRTVVGTNGYLEDAQNTEVGAILRSKGDAGTAYQFASAPFVGREAFPMLTYMDELRENRTGMSKTSMGLDAEALQNTTAAAANSQFSRSQERIELIARIMSSGVRRLYRGLLKLTVENQRAERMVKLRNQWVPVDPRAWRVDMDVVPNVALGGGTNAEKSALLMRIAEKQEQIMMQAGFTNPLCGPKQYFNTLSKLIEAGGFKDPNLFFTDPDDPENQQEPQQPPPDPKMLELQAKAQQAQADMQFKQQQSQQEMALKREQLQQEMVLKREAMTEEFKLKREMAMLEIQTRQQLPVPAVSGVHLGGNPG